MGLEIMRKLNEYTAKWKAAENIDYSIYGTPLETTTYRFAKCLQKRFGVIDGITDKGYITNSYHIHVTEPINAFDKIAIESRFQALSPGGAISYVEVPNMTGNLEAVLQVMRFIYDNINVINHCLSNIKVLLLPVYKKFFQKLLRSIKRLWLSMSCLFSKWIYPHSNNWNIIRSVL